MKDTVWRNPRPELVVECGGGGRLGNCYSNAIYRVTVLRPLDVTELTALRNAGFLGHGQEFFIHGQQVDGRLVPVAPELTWETRRDVKPSGIDQLSPVVVDRATGKVLDETPIHEYTGQVITETIDAPFYVYVVESRVDSSD